MCRWLIAHANLFTAWLFNVIYSTALVYLSTWVVVHFAPQAAGAGVAEVTAYLNGCNLPKVLLLCLHDHFYLEFAYESFGVGTLLLCFLMCILIFCKNSHITCRFLQTLCKE